MVSLRVDVDSLEWTPASVYKGADATYEGHEIFYRKILSDRRQEGGGLAVLSKVTSPPGKLVKIVAVARSDEYVFTLRGAGRVNKAGRPVAAPADYTLNPKGQPHSAMIASEDISLVIYAGESDEVKSVEVLDVEPAPGDDR
jgi:hypothetical protein